ncbi:Uncharacterised protein [Serratia grimesii]|nr:Uncharacterised protein [Serratia grimesii]
MTENSNNETQYRVENITNAYYERKNPQKHKQIHVTNNNYDEDIIFHVKKKDNKIIVL